MNKIKRKSIGTNFSMCVQPAFIIGTNNEDGSHNFAPITWVSVTSDKGDDYMLVISMFGTKRTKQNVQRTGKLSVNLVSRDILELMDYFGTHRAEDGRKDGIPYSVSRGEAVDVPTLDSSRWVYECEVEKSVETGESTTFFCRIKNIQVDEDFVCKDTFDIDLTTASANCWAKSAIFRDKSDEKSAIYGGYTNERKHIQQSLLQHNRRAD